MKYQNLRNFLFFILFSISIALSTIFAVSYLDKDEIRYRIYPDHLKLINGLNGHGFIISNGSSRSQTAMSSDVISKFFPCGSENREIVAHDISRSLPGLGIQYIMLRDAFEKRSQLGQLPYRYAFVEFKKTNYTYKYHPLLYQVGTFGDLWESYVTGNPGTPLLEKYHQFFSQSLKKITNAIALLLEGRSLSANIQYANTQDLLALKPVDVDLTTSQLINVRGINDYKKRLQEQWINRKNAIWNLNDDYERRAIFYARKLIELGEKYGTKFIFHRIPTYFEPAVDNIVKEQFLRGTNSKLYSPNKEWLTQFYEKPVFGDGGHMNRAGSEEYIKWLMNEIKNECIILNNNEKDTIKTAINKLSDLNAILKKYAPISRPEYKSIYSSKINERTPNLKNFIRPLPYPFTNYLTFANDVDSMRWSTAELIHKFMHDELGLPLSDSLFVSHGFGTENSGENSVIDIYGANKEMIVNLLRWYDRGWFDTIHGWGNNNLFATDLDINLTGNNEQIYSLKFVSKANGIFSKSNPISQNKYIRSHVMSFSYKKSGDGHFNIDLIDNDGTTLWSSPNIEKKSDILLNSKFSLPEKIIEMLYDNNPSKQLSVRVRINSQESKLFIPVITISTRTNLTVREDMEKLFKLNLTLPIFTHHGGGFAGLVGIESTTGLGFKSERADLANLLQGDRPDLDYYWIDLMDRSGIKYILPANRTTKPGEIRSIEQALTHFRYNDGIQRHSFLRYYPSKKPERDDLKNLSWTNALGFLINNALDLILENENLGTIIYTHWGLPPKGIAKPNSIQDQFNTETISAFKKLAHLFYSESEKGKRLWLAPLIDVLQYSKALQIVNEISTYDRDTDTVNMKSTIDPVTGLKFPRPDDIYSDLAHVTFFVKDASKAKIFLDGKEIEYVQRNSSVISDSQSISIINNRPYRPILDRLNFSQQEGTLTKKNCTLEEMVSKTGKSQIKIVQEPSHKCSIIWEPAYLDNFDATHFAIRINHTNLPIENISYELTNGKRFNFENQYSDSDVKLFSLWEIGEDLYKKSGKAFGSSLGRGIIKSIQLDFAASSTTSQAFISDIAFLRNNGLPKTTKKFIAAGKISSQDETNGLKVVALDQNGQKIAETIVKTSAFIFDKKFEKNSKIEFVLISKNGNRIHPVGNKYRIMNKDHPSIDFVYRLATQKQ